MDKIWKPHPRQAEFLSLPDSIFEAMYGGAAGGGKSDCLVLLPIIRSFYKHPSFKGIIFRRTYPELEQEIIIRSHAWYPHFGATYSTDKKRWTFKSGAIMQFGHVEYESDVRKYDSAEYNYMGFDELTSFTESQYMYISHTRCRSSKKDLPSIVRSATNPGNVGHTWVKDRFVSPASPNTIIINKSNGLKRIFIPAKASDNPHIDQQYESRLAGLTDESEKRAKLYGDWDLFEGQVFSDFRSFHLDTEPNNAIHVVDAFPIPSWWPKVLAIDWGFSAMTVALWGAISPDDRLFVYKEYAEKHKKVSEWAREIGELCRQDQETFDDIVLCASSWQNRGEDLLIADNFDKHAQLNLKARPADNNRISGKLLLQEFLRWKPRPIINRAQGQQVDREFAAALLRNKGLEAYKDYLASFEDEKPETGIPKLQIFKGCSELIKCIPRCIYAKARNDDKPAEDVREFSGDDPYDCIRYLVFAAQHRIGTVKHEAEYRGVRAEILKNFEQSKDYTYLHRSMEKIERDAKPEFKPIRRFHSIRGR